MLLASAGYSLLSSDEESPKLTDKTEMPTEVATPIDTIEISGTMPEAFPVTSTTLTESDTNTTTTTATAVETPAQVSTSSTTIQATETEPAVEEAINVADWSWNVAKQLKPENPIAYLQGGIDAYNAAHDTNFALNSANGWIMEGSRAINPEQMQELNQLMLDQSDSDDDSEN